MLRIKGKKGVSIWISWVLIIAFAVSLGTFFFYWSHGFASDTADDITLRADEISLCQRVSLRIDNLCQNTQTLNMNVTNVNQLRIDGLVLRMIDIYNEPQTVNLNKTKILPDVKQELTIIKQGVIKKLDLLPTITKGKKRIICQGSGISTETLPFCN